MDTITTMIQPAIFRTYDIRGLVGEELTEHTVYLIGKALGSLLRELGENQMIVGRDGRLSSPILINQLLGGLLASGCDVLDIGMVPTPVLYFATHLFVEHSGVMLTGSHNPSDYNGVKMVIQGKPLAEEGILALYERIKNQQFTEGVGTHKKLDIQHYYIETVANNIQLEKPLKIVVDAGNGVTGHLAPQMFRALGCEVLELFCDIDGSFPNHHPDPCFAENLKDLMLAVKEHEADIGFAFDGDGDRLGVVTHSGEIIAADRLMMLFSKYILEEHQDAKIIFDVKCSDQLPALIKAHGGVPIMWKTGHSLIKAKVLETNALLAGEMSGHLFFNDRWYGFDDALYAAARLLEILASHTEKSGVIFSEIPSSSISPELKVMVKDEEKFQLMQELSERMTIPGVKEVNKIDGLRMTFDHGWGLVRPSNTTPCLILRFEAINDAMLSEIQTLFRSWMLSIRPNLELPF